MRTRDSVLTTPSDYNYGGSGDVGSVIGDENLPPVRGKQHLVGSSTKPIAQSPKVKNPLPKSHREWDK